VSILHLNDKGVVDFHEAEKHFPVSSGVVCEVGDILFSGINPRKNRIAVWSSEGQALCSSEFSIYQAKENFSPFYLAFVWRSAYCLNQLEALTRGTSSSRRRLHEEDLAELLVPMLDVGDQELIAQNEELAVKLDTQAAELVREAKADVEALIEGQADVDSIIAGRIRPPTWEDIDV
jgi:type I restriction enzyme S subunit